MIKIVLERKWLIALLDMVVGGRFPFNTFHNL